MARKINLNCSQKDGFGGGGETPEECVYTVRGSSVSVPRSFPFAKTKVGRDSHPRVISRARGASSASHGVKSHFPRSWRNLRHPGSDSRSRSPLSIRALRSARDRREGRRTTFGSTYRFKIYRSGLASARLVQDDGSRKLPQIILVGPFVFVFVGCLCCPALLLHI